MDGDKARIADSVDINEQAVVSRSYRPGKAEASVHKGHRERVRERWLNAGVDAFSDHEIIEFMLFYCVAQGDVNPLAHRLIDEFGSLHTLMDAAPEEIANRMKISLNTALLLTSVPRIFKRYETSKWRKREPMDSSVKAVSYLYSLFAGEQNECMYMLCLDIHLRLLGAVLLARGTINEAAVYPRAVVQQALTHNAACVIIAHNHLGGNLIPSAGDVGATSVIIDSLKPVNISVLDHLIISGREYYSFSEKKLLGLVYAPQA